MRATILLAIVTALSPAVCAGWPARWPAPQEQSAVTSAPPAISIEPGSSSALDRKAAAEPETPPPVSSGSPSSAPAAAPDFVGSSFKPGPDYLIGLGDVLRISVWKEPEFSATVQVRTDGKISLPLLNDIKVVGTKPTELASSLAEQLKRYVDDPRVTVIVSQARAPVIYMVGEVGHHGPMALTPNMTVLQALVTAGPSTFANTKKIYVLRVEKGVQRKLPVNYKRLVKGQTMNQNIVLQPGDVVVVP